MRAKFLIFSLCLLGTYTIVVASRSSSNHRILTRAQLGSLIAHDNGSDTIQIAVPSQFSMKLGATSCGYQAIYNGLASRNLARGGQFRLAESRKEKFCGAKTPWRKIIILSRTHEEGKKKLEETIAPSFGTVLPRRNSTGSLPDNIRSLANNKKIRLNGPHTEEASILWEETCRLATDISHTKGTPTDNNEISYTLEPDELKEALKKHLTLRAQSDSDKCQRLLAHPTYLENLQFNTVRVTIPCQSSGWLTGDEMLQILKKCEKEDCSSSACPIFFIGDSMEDSMSLRQYASEGLLGAEFDRFKELFQTNEGSQEALFFIRTTGGIFSQPHWYAVHAQKVNNQRQYIITDSAGNPSRLNDRRFLQLKHLIEGKAEPAEPNLIEKHPFISLFIFGVASYYLHQRYNSSESTLRVRTSPALHAELAAAKQLVAA